MSQSFRDTEGKRPSVVHVEKPTEIDGSFDIGTQLADQGAAQVLTPGENKRVLRRIDMVLMPLMFISYGLQYMDKTLLGAASQFGIVQDLGLYDVTIVSGKPQTDLTKFSAVTLIFYWGFFVGSFPASYLAQKFPTGVFCGVSIALWGAITMVTAVVTSYPGMMVLRFFLGFVEAAIPAAFSLIVAMWYRKDEQPLRFAIWVSASGIGGILGTIILWGIGHVKGALHPWQYQFIILGGITILWGVIIALTLPNNPVQARFLTMEDRILAVERMRAGQTGIENSQFKLYQVKEALQDFKTWAFVSIAFTCQLVNGAVSGFGVVIINSFGFGQFQSVLVAGSLGGVAFVTLLLCGVVSAFFSNQRCNLALVTTLPLIIGCAVVWKASWASIGVPLFGFLLLGFFTAPYIMVLALSTANTAGYTKKAITTSLVWGAYCVSNGVAPLLVKTTETSRHYPTLFMAVIPLLVLCILLLVGLQWYLRYCNKQKEAHDAGGAPPNQTAFADLTDKENPNFRYSY